ncbi:MAG: hypothetical protein ACI4E1_12730 [Lachnospira sp.]
MFKLEFRRVFNKNVLLILAAILVIAGFLYINEQEQYATEFVSNYSDKKNQNGIESDEIISGYDSLEMMHNIYKVCFSEIDELDEIDDFEDVRKEMIAISMDREEQFEQDNDFDKYYHGIMTGRIIGKHLTYYLQYDNNIDSIIYKSNAYTNISIFNNDNTFAYYNLKKTAYDYKRLKNIEFELVAERPFDSVMTFSVISFLAILFTIVIAVRINNDRKLKINYVTRASKNGRVKLSLCRLGVIVVSNFICISLLYITILLLAKLVYGGIGNWGASIQSNELFEHTFIFLNRFQYLALIVLVQTITSSIVTVLICIVLSIFNEPGVAVFFAGLFTIVEELLFLKIQPDSIWAIFKYCNLHTLMNPSIILVDYYNIGAGKFIIGRLELGVIFYIVIGVISIAAYIFLSAFLREPGQNFIINAITDKLSKVISRLSVNTPAWLLQIRKIVFSQKMWIAMLVIFYFAFSSVTKVRITYSEEDAIVHQYYEQFSGTFSDDNKDYLENLKAEKSDIDNQIEELKEAKEDAAVIENMIKKSDNYNKAISIIEDEIAYLEKLSEESNKVYTLPQYSFNAFFGKMSSDIQEKYMFYAIIFSIIVSFGAYSYEKYNKTATLIRSAKNRAGYVSLIHKSVAILNLLGAFVIFGINYRNLSKIYGLKYLTTGIRNVRIFENYPVNIPIWAVILLIFIWRYLLMMATSEIVICVSRYSKYYQSMVISCILLVPYFLNVIDIKVLNSISIVHSGGLNALFLEHGVSLLTVLGGCCFIVIAIIAGFISSYKYIGLKCSKHLF